MTKDYKPTFQRTNHLEIVGYTGSDYAGCIDSKKSTLEYIFMMARGDISWKLVKQSLIASLNVEAEFVASFEPSINAIWLWNFVTNCKWSVVLNDQYRSTMTIRQESCTQRTI